MKLTIDGQGVQVQAGATIMEAADRIGVRIPRLCHHPKLPSAQSCRLCAVEVKGTRELVMACHEKAREGMSVHTDTARVRRAREDALEFLLANHPLDCPVCDQSGACDLQDLFFLHSRRPSRFREDKAQKAKAVRAGPEVFLDAERCIACSRCTRFLKEIGGACELRCFGRGDRLEIGVVPGESFAHPYSLCAVDLCPVGALSSADFRFRKPAWMLTSKPSICPGCARGCNVWIDIADNTPLRMRPRENDAINGAWMCDAGRKTYKRVVLEERLVTPSERTDGSHVHVGWTTALARVAKFISKQGDAGIACVLSARASLEENIALAMFAGEVIDARGLFVSGAPSDPSFEDEVLRLSDRNPNTQGVRLLSKKPLKTLPAGMGFIVLDEPGPDDIIAMVSARPSWIVHLTSSQGAPWADVAFPLPTHFEQSGTFISHGGRVQHFEAAFSAPGQCLDVCEIARLLAQEVGRSFAAAGSDQCLQWGLREIKGLAALLEGQGGDA